MKSGGIKIVATYSFWIHHEEIEREFDFEAERALGDFVRLCHKHGLWVWLRIGPWSHGECRNGDFPDWLVHTCRKTRSNDSQYLSFVRRFWENLYKQVAGLSFEEDGPIIGIQFENELMEDAPHLLTLKQLALEIGFKAPLYSVTGWGNVDIPDGEVLPVFGGYADGFWERDITDWPSRFRGNFFFRHTRNDVSIGNDLYQAKAKPESFDTNRYPYAICETGGSMPSAYHRRPLVAPEDTEALAYCMVGSGSNLQGYYMYHGGCKPLGKLTRLQETQDTGYWNDVPVVAYFADAPIGDFGQINPAFHLLRPLHLFLSEFGSRLAPMVPVLPEGCPSSLLDVETLRWAVRHDGFAGFIFVNNHQRHEPLPCHRQVQLRLKFSDFEMLVPSKPVDIPVGAMFIWPVNMQLGCILLRHATAQPMCRVEGCWIFSQVEGIPSEFLFEPGVAVRSLGPAELKTEEIECGVRLTGIWVGGTIVFEVVKPDGEFERIAVLSRDEALKAYKAHASGVPRLIIATEPFMPFNGKPLQTGDKAKCSSKRYVRFEPEYKFAEIGRTPDEEDEESLEVGIDLVKAACPSDPVQIGSEKVAQAPGDEAYERGQVYRLTFPAGAIEDDAEVFVVIEYVGSAARAWCGDRMISDNFYNGAPWVVALSRWREQATSEGIMVQIVPLRKDAPFYLEASAWPTFGDGIDDIAEIRNVQIERHFKPDLAER